MTENPYSTPSCSSSRTDLDQRAHRSAVILPAGVVTLCIAALGVVAGYWISFAEEHPEDKQSVIVFFFAAGSIVGLGCGYLTARVLSNAIPAAYASAGLFVIVVALLLTQNPNYVGAARLIACLAFVGIILSNAIVFATRRMHAPVVARDSQQDARTY